LSRGPSLTIGLPVFNGERYLSQALEAILGQTYEDFELLVSDNASTDRTREICLDFAAKDRRLRYVRNTSNLGAAENYNRVFRASSTKYFKWATHDDIYAPTFVERCVTVLESNPSAVLCFAPAIFIDEAGNEIGLENEEPDYTARKPHRRFRAWVFEKSEGWCHPIMGVIRADVLSRTRLIGKYAGSDRILITELALVGEMHRLPEHLYYRRKHPERSTTRNVGIRKVSEWYDPSASRKHVFLPWWRWGVEYGRAVARSPISPLEKLICTGMMARWYSWHRDRLTGELSAWLRSARGRPSRNNGHLSDDTRS